MSQTAYIVGPTGSGKSYLATHLAAALGGEVVEGSSWIRKLTGCHQHGPEAAQMLSRASARELAKDPEVALRTLLSLTQDPSVRYFIAGLRNPVDFNGLWRHRPGVLIEMQGEAQSAFERDGVQAIVSIRTPDLRLTRGAYTVPSVAELVSSLW